MKMNTCKSFWDILQEGANTVGWDDKYWNVDPIWSLSVEDYNSIIVGKPV